MNLQNNSNNQQEKVLVKRFCTFSFNVFENEIKDSNKTGFKRLRIWTPELTLMLLIPNTCIEQNKSMFKIKLSNVYDNFGAVLDSKVQDTQIRWTNLKLTDVIATLTKMKLFDRVQ